VKGFKLDNNGDVVIEKGKIAMVSDTDLIAQTVRQVLNTNLGEWEFDTAEGIDFQRILAKNPNHDLIQDTIQLGLRQVDETFVITQIDFKQQERRLYINFTATNSDGTEVSISL